MTREKKFHNTVVMVGNDEEGVGIFEVRKPRQN